MLEERFLKDLGQDVLTYLATTVTVNPILKNLKQSPILGYLLAGFFLKQFGLFQDNAEITLLSELGVQFLLFDMGLELSVERLKALAKYAFGMGLPQIILTGGVFAGLLLPVGHAFGTSIIEKFTNMDEKFLSIKGVDEAVVIGLALALSSSAFVLQILQENGQLTTTFGAATLGVLLMQDIAVVPLLVSLPLFEQAGGDIHMDRTSLSIIGAAFLKSMGGLGLLVVVSRLFLRRLFEVVAQTRSSETFVALSLFTVTGTAFITSRLGFSDTLGAFLAGALLADTNYKAQVEADLRPFKGLLLGLFFVTTGARVEWNLVRDEWPVILAMLTGLFSIKTFLTAFSGRLAGLSPPDAIRTGFLLSQGGEFAFVVLSLAQQLGVLPDKLNRVLVIVVIISLFATPSLSQFGTVAANILEERIREKKRVEANGDELDIATLKRTTGVENDAEEIRELQNPVIICGFGRKSQVLASLFSNPLATKKIDYIAVDNNPTVVKLAQDEGFKVVYGEASPGVISSLGIGRPRAIIITYNQIEKSISTVTQMKASFPEVPVYATARDMRHAILLDRAGVDSTTVEINLNALALCKQVLSRVGGADYMQSFAELNALFAILVKGIEARARELDWEGDGTPLGGRNARKDLYVYGGAQSVLKDASDKGILNIPSPEELGVVGDPNATEVVNDTANITDSLSHSDDSDPGSTSG